MEIYFSCTHLLYSKFWVTVSALLYSSFRVKILRDFLQCVAEIIVPVFVLKMVFTCKSETENIKLIILPSWCIVLLVTRWLRQEDSFTGYKSSWSKMKCETRCERRRPQQTLNAGQFETETGLENMFNLNDAFGVGI
jgi:hypothetical protein